MKKTVLLCNENAPHLKELLKGTPRTPPTPCKGPMGCPKFNGGWCPYLVNGGTFETYMAAQELLSKK